MEKTSAEPVIPNGYKQPNCVLKCLEFWTQKPISEIIEVLGHDGSFGVSQQETIDVLLFFGLWAVPIDHRPAIIDGKPQDLYNEHHRYKSGVNRVLQYFKEYNGIIFGISINNIHHATIALNGNTPWEPMKSIETFMIVEHGHKC